MWIELHQSLFTHRKTVELAAALDIEPELAALRCIRLWLWALDNAPSGVLSTCSARAIAFGAGWTDDPDTFVHAMISAGFIDAEMTLHNWHKYAGKLIEKRQANAERMRERRQSARIPSESKPTRARATNVQRTSGERARTTHDSVHARAQLPNRTGPNRTGREQPPCVPPSPTSSDQSALDALFGPSSAPDGAPPQTAGTAGDTLTAGGADDKPKPAGRKRGPTPAPEITPTPDMYAWAAEECGFDERRTNLETLKMLDHFRSNGKTKTDWMATWRNWMRNAERYDRPLTVARASSSRPPRPIMQHPPENAAAKRQRQAAEQRQREQDDAAALALADALDAICAREGVSLAEAYERWQAEQTESASQTEAVS